MFASYFLKNLGLCASCSEGSLITSPNPVCFLPLPYVLTLFDLFPCILICLTLKIFFAYICLYNFFPVSFIIQVFTVCPQPGSLLLHQYFPLPSFNYKFHCLHIYFFSFCGMIAFVFFFLSLSFYWCSSWLLYQWTCHFCN